MALTAPNILEQPRLGDEKLDETYAPSVPKSSMSAPTTPRAPQHRDITSRRSGMRTISASDFIGMGRPPAPPPNTPETDNDPFSVSIPSPTASRTRFNTQEGPRLTFQDSQVMDMQAYVEDSDSENGSTLGDFDSSRSTPHVTIGSQKEESEGERKDEGKGKVRDEGENKRAR